jgi:adenylosuccinate lyase
VQAHAMAAWESESSFQQRVSADPNIRKFLDEKALAHTFDLRRQLRAVDAIFQRVFGTDSEATAISSGAGNASNTH